MPTKDLGIHWNKSVFKADLTVLGSCDRYAFVQQLAQENKTTMFRKDSFLFSEKNKLFFTTITRTKRGQQRLCTPKNHPRVKRTKYTLDRIITSGKQPFYKKLPEPTKRHFPLASEVAIIQQRNSLPACVWCQLNDKN